MSDLNLAPEWVYLGPHQIALPDSDGMILATVTACGFAGPWVFNGAQYITVEAAKRAAERSLGFRRVT